MNNVSCYTGTMLKPIKKSSTNNGSYIANSTESPKSKDGGLLIYRLLKVLYAWPYAYINFVQKSFNDNMKLNLSDF